MTGQRNATRQVRRVVGGSGVRWETLANWRTRACFAAGGLLSVATVLFGVEAFTGFSPQATVTGAISLTGLVLSYVGLLGLYPRLAERTPRLAVVGVALVAIPVVFLVGLLVWGVSGHAVRLVPLPPDVIPAFGTVFVTVFLLFGLGITLFGVASLRTPDLSPAIAVLLFVFAATWFLLLGVSLVSGSEFPPWLDFVTFGLMTGTLLAMGYQFRTGAALPDHADSVGDELVD